MQSEFITRIWALIVGADLILDGMLGFFSNPIVGNAAGALVAVDALHNIVHIGTGLLALAIASMKGDPLINGQLTARGSPHGAVLAISPDLSASSAKARSSFSHSQPEGEWQPPWP